MERTLDLAKKASHEIYGRECAGCKCDLDWIHFRKDSSQRDGYAVLCQQCEAAPRLSTAEHTARMREINDNSEAVKKQRWENQEELKNSAARFGKALRHNDFFFVIQKLVPNLYIMPGNIEGHFAIFKTYPGPQSRLDRRDYEYLFYSDSGILPEFSQYEFDRVRDIPLRESKRGWRTVLLRLIRAKLLTEEKCNQVFGRPEGVASERWHRELWRMRNPA